MLKFLEEPGEGVIAILLTNNLNNMLNTISSRCQILKFNNSKIEDFIKYSNINSKVSIYKIAFYIFMKTEIDDYIENFVNNVISFWKNYESNGKKMIIYEKQFFLDIFKEKDEILNFIRCSILLYIDVINCKLNNEILYYNDYRDIIEEISNRNTLNNILHKLNVLLSKEQLVTKNVNNNMFIDGIIIDME